VKIIFALLLLWALTAGIVSPLVYSVWNLVLAPWLEWREMPVSAAVTIGSAFALLSVRVRRS